MGILLCQIFVIISAGVTVFRSDQRAVLLTTYRLPIRAVCLGVSEKGIHIIVGGINAEEEGSIDDNHPYQVQRVTEEDT